MEFRKNVNEVVTRGHPSGGVKCYMVPWVSYAKTQKETPVLRHISVQNCLKNSGLHKKIYILNSNAGSPTPW